MTFVLIVRLFNSTYLRYYHSTGINVQISKEVLDILLPS